MRLICAVIILSSICLPANAQELSFRSPTGNIHCMIFQGSYAGARCDLGQFNSSFPRPGDCDLDWGYAFEGGAPGPAAPVCAGDPVKDPRAAILDYGHSIQKGGVVCTSEKSGMTCINREGHGFKIARSKQKVF